MEFRGEKASDLELVGGIPLREREIVTVETPVEGLGIIGRPSDIFHDDIGLTVGEDSDLLELDIADIHRVTALPKSRQTIGGEPVGAGSAIVFAVALAIGFFPI